MKTIAFGVLILITASVAAHADEFQFKLGNSSHQAWDAGGIWTDANGTPYGAGVYPGANDTIRSLDYDSTQGTGVPNLYLNGDRTIRRLESGSGGNTRIIGGWYQSQKVENLLTITESFQMKAGAYYFFSGKQGKLTIETPTLVMGSTEYPSSFAHIQIGTSGEGNVTLTSKQTTLGGYSSNIVISNAFDITNSSINLGHVLFDMTPGITAVPWPGEAGIDIGTSGATLQVASLRGGTAETRGSIKGAGTLLIDPGSSDVALTQPADFNRSIQGSLKVVKEGNSLQTFSYANTYKGGTEINGGVLAVRNTTGSGLGTGDIKVRAGGFLAGKGIVELAAGKKIVVESGGVVAPGEDNRLLQAAGFEGLSHQNLTLDGTKLEMEEGAAFNIRVSGDGTSDQITFNHYSNGNLLLEGGEIVVNVSGSLNVNTSYILFNFSNGTTPISSGLTGGLTTGDGFDGYLATFHYDSLEFGGIGTISMTVVAIPEPNLSSLALPLVSGLLLLKRRRINKD